MKKELLPLSLAILFILFGNVLLSQKSFLRFNSHKTSDYYSIGAAACATHDSGFVQVGWTDTDPIYPESLPIVKKFDSEGNILWTKMFSDAWNPHFFIKEIRGNLTLESNYATYFMDSTGSTLWNQVVYWDTLLWPYQTTGDLCIVNNSSYYSSNWLDYPDSITGVISSVDTSGNRPWNNKVSGGSAGKNIKFKSVFTDSLAAAFALGSLDDTSSIAGDGLFVKFNSIGNHEFSRQYAISLDQSAFETDLLAGTPLLTGGYILGGSSENSKYKVAIALILDDSGAVNASFAYQLVWGLDTLDFEVMHGRPTGNGSILLTGECIPPSNQPISCVLKVSQTGWPIWAVGLSDPAPGHDLQVGPTMDGGYYLSGLPIGIIPGDKNWAFAKGKANGDLACVSFPLQVIVTDSVASVSIPQLTIQKITPKLTGLNWNSYSVNGSSTLHCDDSTNCPGIYSGTISTVSGCVGEMSLLNWTGPATVVDWIVNGVSQQTGGDSLNHVFNTSGPHIISVVLACGAKSDTLSNTITFGTKLNSLGLVMQKDTICAGDLFVASTSPLSNIPGFQLDTSGPLYYGTTFGQNISAQGDHLITAYHKDNYGCLSTDTVDFWVAPIPAQPSISQNGPQLISSYSLGNQWSFNASALPGFTTQAINPGFPGDYSVTHTSVFGCESPPSSAYYWNGLQAPNVYNVQQWELYPNPFKNKIQLVGNEQIEDFELRVYDLVGNLVMENFFIGNQERINTENLFQGLYLFEINWNNKRLVRLIMKE